MLSCHFWCPSLHVSQGWQKWGQLGRIIKACAPLQEKKRKILSFVFYYPSKAFASLPALYVEMMLPSFLISLLVSILINQCGVRRSYFERSLPYWCHVLEGMSEPHPQCVLKLCMRQQYLFWFHSPVYSWSTNDNSPRSSTKMVRYERSYFILKKYSYFCNKCFKMSLYRDNVRNFNAHVHSFSRIKFYLQHERFSRIGSGNQQDPILTSGLL